MTRRTVFLGLTLLLVSCGVDRGSTESLPGGDGELIVPAGMARDGLSLVQAPEPFQDAVFEPVGPGYLCGPSGQQFPKKVTLRLPFAADLVAQYERTPEDVRIYTRSAGEARFHPLATRVDSTGLKAETDVEHFSEFQVGVAVPGSCLGKGDQKDCTTYVCQLADFIREMQIAPGGSLAEKAEQACTQASASDIAGALETLGQLAAELLADLTAGTIDAFSYQEITELVQDAQAALQHIPALNPTGTWVGTLPIGGDNRPFAVQLHRRDDGTLMGYVLGGTRAWTVAGGWVHGDRMHLVLEFKSAGAARTLTVEGTVKVREGAPSSCPSGQTCGEEFSLLGTVTEGDDVQTVMWNTTFTTLTERRFVFWDPGRNGTGAEVAVALGPQGNLVSGNYVSQGCADWACAGEIFGLVEQGGDNDHLRLLLDSYENQGSWIEVQYGAASSDVGPNYYIYMGEWQRVAADGSPSGLRASGQAVGGRLMGTNTLHVASMLAAYGNLADDLAARKDFLYYASHPTHPSLAVDFKHFGRTAQDQLVEFASEVAANDTLVVEFGRFRGLATLADARTLPVGTAIGVDFHDRRTGTVDGHKTVYRDADTTPPYDRYRFLKFEGESSELRIAGNQLEADAFGMPFLPTELADFGTGVARIERPFGVHTHEFPLGTDSISARFLEGPARPVVAAGESLVGFALGDSGGASTCPQGTRVNLLTQAGAYAITYGGTTGCNWPWAVPIAHLNPGDPLGTTILPSNGQGGDELRLKAGIDLGAPFCPYWLLSTEARAQMLQAAQGMKYPEQLTEPFLCNPRQGDLDVFPLSLTWTRASNNNPANPAVIRFVRANDADLGWGASYTYETLDASGHVVQQGEVSSLMPDSSRRDGYRGISLLPYNGIGIQGWVRVRPVSASASVLQFDLSGSEPVRADSYNSSSDGSNDTPISDCDDHNPCTDDLETSPGFCVHPANNAPCDDGEPCTSGDACVAGVCVSGSWSCSTDPEPGSCIHASDCTALGWPSSCLVGQWHCDDTRSCHFVCTNQNLSDYDRDGVDDANDACPRDPANDVDRDGLCGDVDNCPSVWNPNQEDTDSDGIGDACDDAPWYSLTVIDQAELQNAIGVHFQLNRRRIATVTHGVNAAATFTRISTPQPSPRLHDAGRPDMPFVRVLVEVPHNATGFWVESTGVDTNDETLAPVEPAQVQDDTSNFAYDRVYYSALSDFEPSEVANVASIEEWGGRKLVALEIHPYRYKYAPPSEEGSPARGVLRTLESGSFALNFTRDTAVDYISGGEWSADTYSALRNAVPNLRAVPSGPYLRNQHILVVGPEAMRGTISQRLPEVLPRFAIDYAAIEGIRNEFNHGVGCTKDFFLHHPGVLKDWIASYTSGNGGFPIAHLLLVGDQSVIPYGHARDFGLFGTEFDRDVAVEITGTLTVPVSQYQYGKRYLRFRCGDGCRITAGNSDPVVTFAALKTGTVNYWSRGLSDPDSDNPFGADALIEECNEGSATIELDPGLNFGDTEQLLPLRIQLINLNWGMHLNVAIEDRNTFGGGDTCLPISSSLLHDDEGSEGGYTVRIRPLDPERPSIDAADFDDGAMMPDQSGYIWDRAAMREFPVDWSGFEGLGVWDREPPPGMNVRAFGFRNNPPSTRLLYPLWWHHLAILGDSYYALPRESGGLLQFTVGRLPVGAEENSALDLILDAAQDYSDSETSAYAAGRDSLRYSEWRAAMERAQRSLLMSGRAKADEDYLSYYSDRTDRILRLPGKPRWESVSLQHYMRFPLEAISMNRGWPPPASIFDDEGGLKSMINLGLGSYFYYGHGASDQLGMDFSINDLESIRYRAIDHVGMYTCLTNAVDNDSIAAPRTSGEVMVRTGKAVTLLGSTIAADQSGGPEVIHPGMFTPFWSIYGPGQRGGPTVGGAIFFNPNFFVFKDGDFADSARAWEFYGIPALDFFQGRDLDLDQHENFSTLASKQTCSLVDSMSGDSSPEDFFVEQSIYPAWTSRPSDSCWDNCIGVPNDQAASDQSLSEGRPASDGLGDACDTCGSYANATQIRSADGAVLCEPVEDRNSSRFYDGTYSAIFVGPEASLVSLPIAADLSFPAGKAVRVGVRMAAAGRIGVALLNSEGDTIAANDCPSSSAHCTIRGVAPAGETMRLSVSHMFSGEGATVGDVVPFSIRVLLEDSPIEFARVTRTDTTGHAYQIEDWEGNVRLWSSRSESGEAGALGIEGFAGDVSATGFNTSGVDDREPRCQLALPNLLFVDGPAKYLISFDLYTLTSPWFDPGYDANRLFTRPYVGPSDSSPVPAPFQASHYLEVYGVDGQGRSFTHSNLESWDFAASPGVPTRRTIKATITSTASDPEWGLGLRFCIRGPGRYMVDNVRVRVKAAGE